MQLTKIVDERSSLIYERPILFFKSRKQGHSGAKTVDTLSTPYYFADWFCKYALQKKGIPESGQCKKDYLGYIFPMSMIEDFCNNLYDLVEVPQKFFSEVDSIREGILSIFNRPAEPGKPVAQDVQVIFYY